MKMGIKEFREKIGEVATGDEIVIVTHRGKRVGRYIPEGQLRAPGDVDLDDWLTAGEEASRQWRAATPNWQDKLRELGVPGDEITELEALDRCS